MSTLTWQVHFTRRRLPEPTEPQPLLATWDPRDLDAWLDAERIPERLPFLLDPNGRYDVDLNRYFHTPQVRGKSPHTWAAIAYDLKDFLTFLSCHRQPLGRKSWRDATEEDRAAYLYWRRKDPDGPHVAGSTWDRAVTTVNGFYRWAVRKGLVDANPIGQRPARGRWRTWTGTGEAEAPAERSHDARRQAIAWFTPTAYRTWRDVGVRGYRPDGLPDPAFRGRTAARNAAFCDLMLRTGLRLVEQTSLTRFELPDLGLDPAQAQHPFWLPAAIAKGGSARTIYVPRSVLGAVWDYVALERAETVALARQAGRYDLLDDDALVIEDPARPLVRVGRGRPVPVARLDPAERARLLVATPDGLEPAAIWLNEHGLATRPACWQAMFKAANARCRGHRVGLTCWPHKLRHSYAVITLEQLQRGHLAELGPMNTAQRRSYQMIFGDPLNWIRCRLGHASFETTQGYLHVLAELEHATRLTLVPDDWEPTELDRDRTSGPIDVPDEADIDGGEPSGWAR